MGVVDSTNRMPSYMNDIEKYGTGGESLFLSIENEKITNKGYKVFDVTKDIDYQYADVDFVISMDGNIDSLPDFETVLNGKSFIKVEVKVDTRAIDTGNLPYECISHKSLGWSVITKSDFVYMILCDEHDGELIAKSVMWIDMNKWHDFVKNRRIEKKVNYIRNEAIVDLLCKINDMRNYKVIISERSINQNITVNGNN